jgi:hypothetical protein
MKRLMVALLIGGTLLPSTAGATLADSIRSQ